MYEQNEKWNMFYLELDPKERQRIFEGLCVTEPDDGANAYRRLMLKRRYTDPKRPADAVDTYLWQCINFPYLYKSAGTMMKKNIKELHKVWKQSGFDQMESFGEAGEKAMYWEIRNMAKRYFETCRNSKNYGKRFFGLMSAKEGGKLAHITRDAWEMSYGLSGRLHEEELMRVSISP